MGNMTSTNTQGKRGWFGDSEGHANAGRKGGLARGRKNQNTDPVEVEFEQM